MKTKRRMFGSASSTRGRVAVLAVEGWIFGVWVFTLAGTAAPSKTIVTVAPVARGLILMRKNGEELGELEPRSWRVLMRLETK